MKFDDDCVSPVETEDILRLSGGGDWHCAYVLLYGPKILELPIAEEMDTTTATEVSEKTEESNKMVTE
jgi:ubiquitin carboxyl-terminal hydrolase 14